MAMRVFNARDADSIIEELAEAAHSSDFVLATDLDGTFLGGSEEDRARLYKTLREGARPFLIYASGRGIETMLPLLSNPLMPRPAVLVADVGATVVAGTGDPIQPLQSDIAARWPGTLRVLAALESFNDLRRQDVPQERRCSFVLEDPSVGQDLRAAVAYLGCDLLLSAQGRYLDVLPAGVSKGATLRALFELLEVPLDKLIVAGDTLNDLSMFELGHLGARGIVVGDAEPELVERANGYSSAYLARTPGAGGILEGLLHHDVIDPSNTPKRPAKRPAPTATEDVQLVMVYHRLPFEEAKRDGKTERIHPRSPNGIIPSLLGFFDQGRSGVWVAWSKQSSREPPAFEQRVAPDPTRYSNLITSRIALTDEDVDLFYRRFSKEAFWPVIFNFPSKAVFDEALWSHFVEINRAFAERTAREAEEGALVWVHDYNLWMVPGLLRQLRPDLWIAFFHHTAFPPPDIFNIVPWRREIIGSLLACDYIGFHIPRYVENFVDVVRSYAPIEGLSKVACAPRFITYGCALGVDQMTTALEVGDRRVRLGAHPVGVDVERISRLLSQADVRDRIAAVEHEMAGRLCILSLERLDYVKGPLEKLEAFERLLENHPDLHGRVVLLSVVTPATPGMQIYHGTREKVDEAVGRVNGRFASLDWVPVHYFFQSLSFEDVLAYCAVADVAWISPLRDGLNLVAKEYVAAKAATNRQGVLVLSEFAGAAVELPGAILTNPYDRADLEQELYRALTLPPAESEQRMRRLASIVHDNDVKRWGKDFLQAVFAVEGSQAATSR